MTFTFSVTWDYRCPFARNVHDHLVEAMQAGAPWSVTFVPFSLGQVHVAEGEADIWDRPADDSGLLALQAGVVVRDHHPDRFLAVHRGLFDARHEHGLALRDEQVVRDVLAAEGVDADAVLAEIDTGAPLETIRKEHEAAVTGHEVWGVPTFIMGESAVFVRLMNPAERGDPAASRTTIERLVALLVGWPELNEFKHTSVRR
ncbi:MAG: DsbA family protein [Acidimicrobiales bacterium]